MHTIRPGAGTPPRLAPPRVTPDAARHGTARHVRGGWPTHLTEITAGTPHPINKTTSTSMARRGPKVNQTNILPDGLQHGEYYQGQSSWSFFLHDQNAAQVAK